MKNLTLPNGRKLFVRKIEIIIIKSKQYSLQRIIANQDKNQIEEI